MESMKAFWKTRVYSRIVIDNIGNQGFIPEIICYKKINKKKRLMKKKERKQSFSFITVRRKPTLKSHFLEL